MFPNCMSNNNPKPPQNSLKAYCSTYSWAPGIRRPQHQNYTQEYDRNIPIWLLCSRYVGPEGSKYPIFKVSGTKSHARDGLLELNSLIIGYLDPLGYMLG